TDRGKAGRSKSARDQSATILSVTLHDTAERCLDALATGPNKRAESSPRLQRAAQSHHQSLGFCTTQPAESDVLISKLLYSLGEARIRISRPNVRKKAVTP